MWGIAQAHNMSVQQLESLNPHIKDPDLIFPGQQINLGGSGSTGGTAAGSGSSAATATDSSVVFPKTSSYQATGSSSQAEEASAAKLGGWANGTGDVPPDPAKNVIEAVSKTETNPLKINDKTQTT
jgi:LysM repeat protein